MRSIKRRGAARIDRIDLGAEPLLERAAQIVGVLARLCGRRSGASEHDAAEPGSAQPIFVVHRRLVDHVGEAGFSLGGAVPEKHQMTRRAESPSWRLPA